MLLGQAESGKSTLQKQFQLYYSSATLERERPAWRPIVFFNVLKAVRMVLDELEWEYGLGPRSVASGSGSGSASPLSGGSNPPSPVRSPAGLAQPAPLHPSTSGSGSHSGSGSSSTHTHTHPRMHAGWLAELAALAGEVAITELDIRMPVPSSQANLNQQKTDYTSVVRQCNSVTGCIGVCLPCPFIEFCLLTRTEPLRSPSGTSRTSTPGYLLLSADRVLLCPGTR